MKKTQMKECKFCGSEVASNARSCPKCGATLKKSHGCLTSILIFLGIIVLIIVGMFATGKIKRVSREDRLVTVVTNSGETVEMTKDELEEIYNSNEALFNKEYHRAKVSYEFTVDKVETNIYLGSTATGTAYDRIKCKESYWNVLLIHDSFTNLHELKVGDTIYVESQLQGNSDDVFSKDTVLIKK